MESVFITVGRPHGSDPGRAEEGFYKIIGDTVILVDRNGNPLTNVDKRYEQKFSPGEDTKAIAGRMLRRWLNAGKGDTPRGFDRPLRYKKIKY